MEWVAAFEWNQWQTWSGLRRHLLRLENPALRVNERDALALENEPGAQLPMRQVTMHLAQHFDTLERLSAHQGFGVVGAHRGKLALARCVGYQA